MNKNDAEVALRSFGRRYAEVLAGPKGDDAWERLVRAPGPHGSALEITGASASMLASLATLAKSLPSNAAPTLTPAASFSADASIDSVVASVKAAASAAGDALDARSNSDLEREVNADGETISFESVVERVVAQCVKGLKDAEAAIDAAR